MKTYYLVFLTVSIVLFGFTEISSQNYKITYDYNFSRDSTNLEASKYHVRCFLFYSQSTGSKFIGEGALIQDSLVVLSESGQIPVSEVVRAVISGPKPHDFKSAVHIKHANPDKYIVTDKLNGKRYIYSEQKSIKWKVLKDLKQIGGYQCQKAICMYGGREYEAWFTSEVPIATGPYKFVGLPGLVVKISGDKGEFIFDLASIKVLEEAPDVSIWNSLQYIETSKEELMRARSGHFNNLLESTNSSGGGRILSLENGRDLNSEGKFKNNFIEKN